MTRPAENVSIFHAGECEPCLTSMCREDGGFHLALANAADVYDEDGNLFGDDDNIYLRINKTRTSYAYPMVRARKGYVDWHGARELLPGAGLLAKSVSASSFTYEVGNMYLRVTKNGTLSESDCLVVFSAVAIRGVMIYIALLVSGYRLFSDSSRVDFSVRLNFLKVEEFHKAYLYGKLTGNVSTFFRHPIFDDDLQKLQFANEIDRVGWGNRDDS